ncbi:hypothetical protein NDU88_006412 [Pleurodeles waltl]|uniref:Uncharacterized protein n=1 Tax=Pleurodeles waltl TaxID=8319 RepID=A0AAV7UPK3_PLEWA|nr:hypothetical protein NDU88_006412 [Pleurodeles waltl]
MSASEVAGSVGGCKREREKFEFTAPYLGSDVRGSCAVCATHFFHSLYTRLPVVRRLPAAHRQGNPSALGAHSGLEQRANPRGRGPGAAQWRGGFTHFLRSAAACPGHASRPGDCPARTTAPGSVVHHRLRNTFTLEAGKLGVANEEGVSGAFVHFLQSAPDCQGTRARLLGLTCDENSSVDNLLKAWEAQGVLHLHRSGVGVRLGRAAQGRWTFAASSCACEDGKQCLRTVSCAPAARYCTLTEPRRPAQRASQQHGWLAGLMHVHRSLRNVLLSQVYGGSRSYP